MARHVTQLGATHLTELGAVHLIELGQQQRAFMGATPAPESIRSIYNFVNVWDDPLAATGISDDDLTPEALNIVKQIRAVNRRVTATLGSSIALSDIDGYADVIGLAGELHRMELGKSFFKRVVGNVKRIHKHVAKKIINVVKSPAFLSVAALVVNVIPGVGQIASVGLAAAAAARKIYAQKVDEKKMKAAQNKANAQAQAEFLKEIKAYNKKTQEYFESAGAPVTEGQLIDKDGNPTNDPTKAPGIKYPIRIGAKSYPPPPGWVPDADPAPAAPATPTAAATTGTNSLQPAPTETQVNQAAALPVALAVTNGQGAGDARLIMSSFPPEQQKQIAAEAAEAQRYIAHDPNFQPTSIKAIGQFVAMSEFDRGAGTNIMTPEQHALADQVKANATPEVLKAIEVGRQNLITSGAIDGPEDMKVVAQAIADGAGGLSYMEMGLIGLGFAVVGYGAYKFATRK